MSFVSKLKILHFFNLLNSNPGGAASANLVDITQYALDVTHVNITATTKLTKKLIPRNPNNLEAIDHHYKLCLNRIHKDVLSKVEST